MRSNGEQQIGPDAEKHFREAEELAIRFIQEDTSGDYSSLLDPAAQSLLSFPVSPDKIEGMRSRLSLALTAKGLSATDADCLIANLFDGAPGKLTHGLLTARDLLTGDFQPPAWVIPQILPVGLIGLSGRQKIGKSWLALQMASAVSHGGQFFGQVVQRAPTLSFFLEDPPYRQKDRMQTQRWDPRNRLAHFMGAREFAREIGDLGGSGCEILVEMIRTHGYKLVIVDTFSRAFSGDQNDVQAMTRALAPLQEVSHQLSAAIVIVDHHRKGANEFAKDPLTDVVGSQSKGAIVDTAIGVYRDRGSNEAQLVCVGRDLEDKTLTMRMDWSIGTWQLVSDEESLSPGQSAIFKYLKDFGGAKLSVIVAGLGKDWKRDKATVFNDLGRLMGKQLVDKSPDGAYCVIDSFPEAPLLHTTTTTITTDTTTATEATCAHVPF